MEKINHGLITMTPEKFKDLCKKHTSKELEAILGVSSQTIKKTAIDSGFEIKNSKRGRKKKEK